jgi:hypothetical protein
MISYLGIAPTHEEPLRMSALNRMIKCIHEADTSGPSCDPMSLSDQFQLISQYPAIDRAHHVHIFLDLFQAYYLREIAFTALFDKIRSRMATIISGNGWSVASIISDEPLITWAAFVRLGMDIIIIQSRHIGRLTVHFNPSLVDDTLRATIAAHIRRAELEGRGITLTPKMESQLASLGVASEMPEWQLSKAHMQTREHYRTVLMHETILEIVRSCILHARETDA